MNTDLMGTAGKRMDAQHRITAIFFYDLILSFRVFTLAFRRDRHSLAMGRVTINGSDNTPLICRWSAFHQCQIDLLNIPALKLPLQPDMAGLIFGNQDNAGSILIQAMDNTGSFFAADTLQIRSHEPRWHEPACQSNDPPKDELPYPPVCSQPARLNLHK